MLMASGNSPTGAVSSLPLTEETTTKRRKQLAISISMPPLPTLPIDILAEILCRLPVKLLLQLRCLCKSFNSLILDPKFAKKHLRFSTKLHRLIVGSANLGELVIIDSIIPSDLLITSNNIKQTKLSCPNSLNNGYGVPLHVCSCDGILCFTMSLGSAVLWNPSFRKSKILSPFNNIWYGDILSTYSFGYDHFIHNYKIVAISTFNDKSEVRVHILGTDDWRRIQDFPYSRPRDELGIFVSGTVNWLASKYLSSSRVIVSLDLENESYQKFSLPDLDKYNWTLGVLRECLCIFASGIMFLDVWIMKEYGNKESWIKLYHIPYMEKRGLCGYKKASYFSNNDQLLMDFYTFGSYDQLKLVVYDSKNRTWKIVEIHDIHSWMNSQIYIESLISPCF